jgi:hypothetical protein
MSGFPSPDQIDETLRKKQAEREFLDENRVERPWRPEHERPENQDQQDGSQDESQDGDGQPQEGASQDGQGNSSESGSGQGTPQQGNPQGSPEQSDQSGQGQRQHGQGRKPEQGSTEKTSGSTGPGGEFAQGESSFQGGAPSRGVSGPERTHEPGEQEHGGRKSGGQESLNDMLGEGQGESNASSNGGDAEKKSFDLGDDVKKGWQGALGGNQSAEFNSSSGAGEESDNQASGQVRSQVSLPEEPTDLDSGDEDFASNKGSWSEYTENVEEGIQKVAYSQNDNHVGSEWTPQKVQDKKIATSFARIVDKLAEDQSHEKVDGDAYWDTRRIMRRQITKESIHNCRHDYTRERLALLIDTSPSCSDEAIFYSKIAYGSMLRNDIDLYCAPNGRIDGKFDLDHMRFVYHPLSGKWHKELEGRIVLFFSDWDGWSILQEQSHRCSIHWFDNTNDEYHDGMRADKINYDYNGEHRYCADKHDFLRLARKIRR